LQITLFLTAIAAFSQIQMKQIFVKYGFWMCLGLPALFLLLHILGFCTNPNINVLYAFIPLSLFYLAAKYFKRQLSQSYCYPLGSAKGRIESILGLVCFALLLVFLLVTALNVLTLGLSKISLSQSLFSLATFIVIFVGGVYISLIATSSFTRVINWRKPQLYFD